MTSFWRVMVPPLQPQHLIYKPKTLQNLQAHVYLEARRGGHLPCSLRFAFDTFLDKFLGTNPLIQRSKCLIYIW